MLDPRYQYALHAMSCTEQPISDKMLSRFRKSCYDYGSAYGVDLLSYCITGLGGKIAKMKNINPRINSRLKSILEEADKLLSVCGSDYDDVTECQLLLRCLSKQTVVEEVIRRLRTKEKGSPTFGKHPMSMQLTSDPGERIYLKVTFRFNWR